MGSCSTNGTDLSASFTPTNGGCGTLTFYVAYSNGTPCFPIVYTNSSIPLNFSVADLSTNCTTNLLVLGNNSTTTNFCFGTLVSLSVTNNNVTNSIVVTTNWPPACSTNAGGSFTNVASPTILSNWWTASVGSCYSTNGTNLVATFTPTTNGSGTITFFETYTNKMPCDTNVCSASNTIPFNVLLAFNIVDSNNNPISSANSNNVVIVGQNIALHVQTANSCSETWSNYQWSIAGYAVVWL